MVESIVSTGLAIGCIYALIAIAYNVMFSASRVFSFTAGTLGMLGGVLGSLFIARMGLPVAVGFLLALAGGAALGIAMSYHMYSSWGFSRSRSSVSLLVAGMWNNFAKLGLLIVDFAWMWPLFSGGLLTYDQWHMHMWFPSWI